MKRRHVPLLLLVVVVALFAAPASGQDPVLPQCADLVDNDGDGQTDFPNDSDCASVDDDSEAPPPPPLPDPPTVTLTQAPSVASDTQRYTLKAEATAGAGATIDRVRFLESAPGVACADGTLIDVDRDAPYLAEWTPTTGGDRVLKAVAIDSVDQRACDSKAVTVDTGAPSAPSLGVTKQGTAAYVVGLQVYVNPSGEGSFRVTAVVDPDVIEVRFPGGKIDKEGPSFTATYLLDELSEGTKSVTAWDGGHESPAAHFDVVVDTTAPVDVSVQYTDGNDVDGTIEVSVTNGSDSQSGVDLGSGLLERRLGTLTDTALGPACENLGDWTATTPTNTIGRLQCAFYRYSISDNVGNTTLPDAGPAAVWFDDRDRIPPANVTNARARAGDHRVRLTYETPTVDFERVKIFRTKVGDPGSKRLAFNGTATRFVDRTVYNGARYVYEIVTYDATGNRPDPGVLKTVLPTSRYLLTPRDGAIRSTPPRLTWKPKRRATFYNVKLVRNNRTILSAFPRDEDFKVRWRWKYKGVTRRYRDGTYFWYVWPRIGGRYGALMGWSRFSRV